MRALYSNGTSIPMSRVLREHRAALVPLVAVLAVCVVVLAVVLLPLSRNVSANESRAEAAERLRATAEGEFRQAEGLREGKARASTDLQMFYTNVLPADIGAARRIVQSKLQQMAAKHNVEYRGSATVVEDIKESALERMRLSVKLSGDYDDIRAFIYALETAPDFVVIDNMLLAEGLDSNAPLSLALELSTYYRAMPLPVEAGRR